MTHVCPTPVQKPSDGFAAIQANERIAVKELIDPQRIARCCTMRQVQIGILVVLEKVIGGE